MKRESPSPPSHPTRVRGLKLASSSAFCPASVVAPHAGAWIETSALPLTPAAVCLSHPTRVRGLKQDERLCQAVKQLSHPTRVRGLKHTSRQLPEDAGQVAPHAGAWIETTCPAPAGKRCTDRTPHRGVIEMGRLERSCKPACHDAPLRIHDLKLPAKKYPKAGLKQKSPHGVFRKGFLLFPGAGEGT